MDYKAFERRLKRLEVNVTMATIRNWAKKGLIDSYESLRSKKRGRGGRPTNWLEKAYEQAAGIWAMQQVSATTLPTHSLKKLRERGDIIHAHGDHKLRYPDINKFIEQSASRESFVLGMDDLTDPPVPIPADEITIVLDDDVNTHELLTTYLCAKERAWHTAHGATEPWLIKKPVRAFIYYILKQPLVLIDDVPTPDVQIMFSHSRLEKLENGKKDEVVFFFNNDDVRAMPAHIHLNIMDSAAISQAISQTLERFNPSKF